MKIPYAQLKKPALMLLADTLWTALNETEAYPCNVCGRGYTKHTKKCAIGRAIKLGIKQAYAHER